MKIGITFTDIEMCGRRLTIGDAKALLSELDQTEVLECCALLSAINEVAVGPGIAWESPKHLSLLDRLLHDLLTPVHHAKAWRLVLSAYTGATRASGIFRGGISVGLPFDGGVILSSGDIHLAAGPNDSGEAGAANGRSGDAQLDLLCDALEVETGGSLETHDAVVLEFDIIPASSVLQFDYVFASEEYPEFVANLKNDAVAFFVNGQNIAWIPGTTDPVSIFTVNSGRNSGFYRENPAEPGEVFDLQYDGFTSTAAHPWLTATASVQPGVSAHVKIVIADESDSIYDSAVFIRARRPFDCASPCP